MIAAFCSTAFGGFLLAFACFEHQIGDLECAASTSVLSGFFLGSGLLLFVASRRQRARSARLAAHDAAPARRREVLSPDVVVSAPGASTREPSDFERSKAADKRGGEVEPTTDFAAFGKRADVCKLIEELRHQTLGRQQ